MTQRLSALAIFVALGAAPVAAAPIIVSSSQPLPAGLVMTAAWTPTSSAVLNGASGGWMLLGDPRQFFLSSDTAYASASFDYWSIEGWTVRASLNQLTVGSGVNGGQFLPPAFDYYDWMISGGIAQWKHAEIASALRSLDFSYPGPQTDTLFIRNLTLEQIPVPEPATVCLVSAGLAAAFSHRRRRAPKS